MQRNLVNLKPLQSTFLASEKDAETIIRRLFIENQPHSDELKRLLVINAPDCLTNMTNAAYKDKIAEMNIKKLRDEGYVTLVPRLCFDEHDEVRSYIIIGFDNFVPNTTNPEFRDCTVTFDVICHNDEWQMDNYALRPLKIAGYIDGIIQRNPRFSGIGVLNFLGCSELILTDTMSGYTLMYRAVHWTDDEIPLKDEDNAE